MNKRQQRAAKIAAQQALTNGARTAGRELTDAEQAQFDALQREIDALTLEIEAEERAAAQTAQPTPDHSGRQREGEDPDPDADAAGVAQRAIEAERQRVSDITNLCRDFDVDPAQHIREGHTMEQVRAAILEGMRATGHPANVQVTRDEQETFRQRATDALLMRAGVQIESPAEGADQLRAMSLRDLGIECLSREGRNVNELLRMHPDELYAELSREFYNPSAAFPAIMDQTIRKGIVELYNMVPTTFQAITTKGTLRDF